MNRVYEFTRKLNGESRLEVVMLLSPNECDFDQILHRVGLELCMSPQGRKRYKGVSELTFEELMDSLTPEMLKPYGVTMCRLRDGAKQVDGAAPYRHRSGAPDGYGRCF